MKICSRTVCLFLAGSLAAGCGESESILAIKVDSETVPSDGRTTARITVSASFRGEHVDDGTRINLSTTTGEFQDRNRTETTIQTTGGEASVHWKPPYPYNGEVEITASYSDPYKMQQEDRLVLFVTDPPPVDGASFRFWCAAQNTRRPRSQDAPVRIPCTVEAQDIEGNDVPVDDVRFGFLAECGRFEFDRDGNLEWVLSPGERPWRVEPLGDPYDGEPRWFDQNAGLIRNPRDGIATLVVHTHGMPTGQMDPLYGDPFVDTNDSGEWNEVVQPEGRQEPYYDADGTGRYDGPTGDTGPRRIWRWYKIMVTGPVSEVAPEQTDDIELWDTGDHHRQNISVPHQHYVSIGLMLVDENLNPIASHPRASPDTVELSGEHPRGIVRPSEQGLVEDTMGLSFHPLTGMIQAGESRTGYLQGGLTYRFRIHNDRTIDPEEPDPPQPWSLGAVEISRHPFPGERTRVTEKLDGHELPMGYLE